MALAFGDGSTYYPEDFVEAGVISQERADMLKKRWWKGPLLLANADDIESLDWWDANGVGLAICASAGPCASRRDGWFNYPEGKRVMNVPPTRGGKGNWSQCIERLEEALPFITATLGKCEAGAFHCKAGKDRSPLAMHMFLAAIAYDDEALQPDDARSWERIKSKRPAMLHQQARPHQRGDHMDMVERRNHFFATQVHNVRATVPKWFRCSIEDHQDTDCEEGVDHLRGTKKIWQGAKTLCIGWRDPSRRVDAKREFDTLWPTLVRGLPVIELEVILNNFADGRTFKNPPAAGKGKGKPQEKKGKPQHVEQAIQGKGKHKKGVEPAMGHNDEGKDKTKGKGKHKKGGAEPAMGHNKGQWPGKGKGQQTFRRGMEEDEEPAKGHGKHAHVASSSSNRFIRADDRLMEDQNPHWASARMIMQRSASRSRSPPQHQERRRPQPPTRPRPTSAPTRGRSMSRPDSRGSWRRPRSPRAPDQHYYDYSSPSPLPVRREERRRPRSPRAPDHQSYHSTSSLPVRREGERRWSRSPRRRSPSPMRPRRSRRTSPPPRPSAYGRYRRAFALEHCGMPGHLLTDMNWASWQDSKGESILHYLVRCAAQRNVITSHADLDDLRFEDWMENFKTCGGNFDLRCGDDCTPPNATALSSCVGGLGVAVGNVKDKQTRDGILLRLAKCFLLHGADPKQPSIRHDRPVLAQAAMQSGIDMAVLLLNFGASVSDQCNDGRTVKALIEATIPRGNGDQARRRQAMYSELWEAANVIEDRRYRRRANRGIQTGFE